MGWDTLPPDANAVHSNDSTLCTSTPCTTVEHAAFVAWAVLFSHSRTRVHKGAAPLPAHTWKTSGSRRCACCTSRHGGGRSIRQQAAACKAQREAHAHKAARETYLAAKGVGAAGARGPMLPSPLCVSCRFRMKTMLSWSSPCCPAPAVGPRAEHQRQLVRMVQVPAWRLEAPVACIHCAGPSSYLTPTAAQLTCQSLQKIGHEYSCLSVQQASLQASGHSPIFWRTSARR